MKRFVVWLAVAAFALNAANVNAQNMHVATNFLDYLNFGTINAEFGLSPVPKWSVYIKGRYNPFIYKSGDIRQNKVASLAVGAKYWFWYSNSGWFLNSHLGYGIYNTGGIYDEYAYEGEALGLVVGCGYALMLGKKWNLDFGFGLQAGVTAYTRYACPKCGRIEEKQNRFFLVPSNLMVQLSRIL